ncbi:hypothetical protein FRC02_002027 [Tulasnella sp. 418]|nr:hypothetical protein FRC02_002027 [Tulasnella sp. 418]
METVAARSRRHSSSSVASSESTDSSRTYYTAIESVESLIDPEAAPTSTSSANTKSGYSWSPSRDYVLAGSTRGAAYQPALQKDSCLGEEAGTLGHGIKTVDPRVITAFVSKAIDVSGRMVLCGNAPAAVGGHSDVWYGRLNDIPPQGNTPVAIKVLRASRMKVSDISARLLVRLKREVNIWEQLQHENIVPLIGFAFTMNGSPCLVAPWYTNGNVLEYLKNNPESDRSELIINIIDGANYMHTHTPPIVHGDIKAANVMIDHCGSARIGDFGLGRIDYDGPSGLSTSTLPGSTRWMPKEVLEGSRRSVASDMYALSLTALEIYSEAPPFPHLDDVTVLLSIVLHSAVPERWHYRPLYLPDKLWKVFETGWSTKPNDRPSANVMRSLFIDALSEWDAKVFPLQSRVVGHLRTQNNLQWLWSRLCRPQSQKSGTKGQPGGVKRALLIAVGYLNVPGFSPILGAYNDIRLLRGMLLELGFLSEDILVLSDSDDQILSFPSRKAIVSAFVFYRDNQYTNFLFSLENSKPFVCVWDVTMWGLCAQRYLSVSGHGHQISRQLNATQENNIGAFVPADGSPDDPTTWITSYDLQESLINPLAPGASLFMLLDSCHSESLLDLPYEYTCTVGKHQPTILKGAPGQSAESRSVDELHCYISSVRTPISPTVHVREKEKCQGVVLCIGNKVIAPEIKVVSTDVVYGNLTYLFVQCLSNLISRTAGVLAHHELELASTEPELFALVAELLTLYHETCPESPIRVISTQDIPKAVYVSVSRRKVPHSAATVLL